MMGKPALKFIGPRATWTALAVAVVTAGTVPAQGQTPQLADAGSTTYVIQFRDRPGISYDGELEGFAATKPRAGATYNKYSDAVRSYSAHLTATHDAALSAVGAAGSKIYDYTHAMNGVAARLTAAQAAALRSRPEVVNVWADYAMDVDTNNSPEFLGLTFNPQGLRSRFDLRGEDVIVGILDTGAVQEHPSFADTKTEKLPWQCETDYPPPGWKDRCDELRAKATKVVYGPPPARWNGICQPGEGWSADDCNNKMIGARWFVDGFLAGRGSVVDDEFLSPRDSSGHGSHTAGTAVGNEGVPVELGGQPVFATISGMAPRARLAVYKVCWLAPGAANFSCFFSDSAAATDAAVADGVDVLNFSVGTAASFTDPQDLAFLDASSAGVFVARSAGNSGPEPATTNAGEPWVTSVAASTLDGFEFVLAAAVNSPASIAGNYDALEGAITRSLLETGPITGDLTAADPIEACEPLTNTIDGIALIARGSCSFVAKVENAVAAGATAIFMYSDSRPKTVMGGTATDITQSVPGIMIDNEPGLAILAQLQAGEAVNVTISGSNYQKVVREGGNQIAGFSSRGPYSTESDWIKPDITAPGVGILAPNTPDQSDGSQGGFFTYLSGTSMSGPHIAGIGALLVEAHPDWSPAQVKSAIMTTARQNMTKEDGETAADPFDFGAGHVEPNRALNPGLTYDAGLLDYLAASCGTVSPLLGPGDCEFIEDALGFSTDPADLNLPTIGIGELPGSKTIKRTVTAVADYGREGRQSRYRVHVEAPEGFTVTVSPNKFTAKPGDQVTYEVTITNVSAPANTWRFGYLEWTDGRHKVRSNIAVNAQALVAPAEVDVAGASGSTDFDVTFGYTGDYTAQVHGLNEASLTLVDVEDDPTDTFEFLGPGVQIAFLEEIPAGTALARWSLYNEYTTGDDDIDLYLYYCPEFSCTQIASSAGATSNETVEILLPQNDPDIEDPYLVFTHAFQTDGGAPQQVILFDWAFGLTDDAGNMTVAAPSSAAIGETANVSVSWSGLSSGIGFKQLGAISHSDADGIVGLTLIDVANDPGAGICDFPGICVEE